MKVGVVIIRKLLIYNCYCAAFQEVNKGRERLRAEGSLCQT